MASSNKIESLKQIF